MIVNIYFKYRYIEYKQNLFDLIKNIIVFWYNLFLYLLFKYTYDFPIDILIKMVYFFIYIFYFYRNTLIN